MRKMGLPISLIKISAKSTAGSGHSLGRITPTESVKF